MSEIILKTDVKHPFSWVNVHSTSYKLNLTTSARYAIIIPESKQKGSFTMKKSYIERAMHMAELLSSYMEDYNNNESIYVRCKMAAFEYNKRHSRSAMCFDNGSTRFAFIISDYVLKVDYNTIRSFGNSETELKAWDFICKNGMEEYFAEITKYVSKSGITFYIMPRIKHIGEYDEESLFEFLYETDIVAYSFIQDYFCDFHEENFGVKNGHPVMIDYAWNYCVEMEDGEDD